MFYYLNGTPSAGQTTTGVGQIVPDLPRDLVPRPPYQSFQVVVTGTGSVSATVQIMASNDKVNFFPLGSAITIASGASPQTAGLVTNSTYRHFQANVTAVTGTGASVTTTMSE